MGFPGDSDSKESVCNSGDPGLIHGLGRAPGEGNGNLLQYSYLENPMDQALSPLSDAVSTLIPVFSGHSVDWLLCPSKESDFPLRLVEACQSPTVLQVPPKGL